MMVTVSYCQTMARYNAWMNANLYELSAKLSDEQRTRDLGAFFKSLHGTLAHLVLADLAWMRRFVPATVTLPAADETLTSLDQILFTDFAEMSRVRAELDRSIEAFAKTLTQPEIDSDLTYTRMNGMVSTIARAAALAHFFNHQTHHRGQATTLLMQLGVDPGVTDLILLPKVTQ
jgi:uncharacterized damage-inducible protein DinB